VAETVKATLLRRLCDHDRVIYVQLPSSAHTLLCPWIRHFTMIIFAWWLWASSKEVKETTEKLGNEQLLSGRGFVQNMGPPSLSRGRRINTKQTNKHQTNKLSVSLAQCCSVMLT